MLWEKEKLLVNLAFTHSVFKRACISDTQKQGLVWERVNSIFKFKYIQFISTEKLIPTTYTNLSQLCFLKITLVLVPNV